MNDIVEVVQEKFDDRERFESVSEFIYCCYNSCVIWLSSHIGIKPVDLISHLNPDFILDDLYDILKCCKRDFKLAHHVVTCSKCNINYVVEKHSCLEECYECKSVEYMGMNFEYDDQFLIDDEFDSIVESFVSEIKNIRSKKHISIYIYHNNYVDAINNLLEFLEMYTIHLQLYFQRNQVARCDSYWCEYTQMSITESTVKAVEMFNECETNYDALMAAMNTLGMMHGGGLLLVDYGDIDEELLNRIRAGGIQEIFSSDVMFEFIDGEFDFEFGYELEIFHEI